MWTGPSRSRASVAGDDSSSSLFSFPRNSFSKDGRKITVGDCALFKPPQDSPPFIGIIRSLTCGKDNGLKLGVNWLYRPGEVKLGRGILLEAVPNEIFYSFHKDEIPAASLLHPCKVAFLPKGSELSSGSCSFVCYRVYDITNKCLWRLTDEDYIDDRQEEVDQLLYRTRIEMHATVQPGGCSPKPMNGPLSTFSDIIQNSASSFPSPVKGKKRERRDQGSEPVKRERSIKLDDGDFGNCKVEGILKSEIAKITEKGGLVDSKGVEKLVQLMLPQISERKIDLFGRSMLASVVAATDKMDCLNRFVQLKGLPLFDKWLLDVHKGKFGDGICPTDSDKSVEEFLLVLLCALDKLPVNLYALQMCNIGKSVNHLRSHTNVEIQKKARSLVDTWKKRVEAEMDAKSDSNPDVPWSARSRLTEISHGVNRLSGRTSEVAVKSSVTLLSPSKPASVKLVQADTTTKSASTSLGSMRLARSPVSASTNPKDGQARNAAAGGASDIPLTTVWDEKSSSSSQSNNRSHSCSSDHAKSGGLAGKEDARSSTAGSTTGNKIVVVPLRHRKSVNGFPGTTLPGVQREAGSSRSSVNRNPTEGVLQSSLTFDKALDGPLLEGASQKLIKIPNCGHSPVESASGGSVDDPTVMNSRASSTVVSEKSDHLDQNLKDRDDAYGANLTSDVNNESWQSNDFRDVMTGSDEGDGSPATVAEDEHCRARAGDDPNKLAEVSRAASSSSGNEQKSGKLNDTCFSSINALVESCANYPEGKASLPVGDYVGMNLPAGVAAEGMSKSDAISPSNSPQQNNLALDDSNKSHELKSKSSAVDDLTQDRNLSTDGPHDQEKHFPRSSDGKTTALFSHGNPSNLNGLSNSSNMVWQQIVHFPKNDGITKDTVAASAVTGHSVSHVEKIPNGEWGEDPKEKSIGVEIRTEDSVSVKPEPCSSLLTDDKLIVSCLDVKSESVEGLPFYQSMEANSERKNVVEEFGIIMQEVQMPSALLPDSATVKGGGDEGVPHFSGSGKDMNAADNFNEESTWKGDVRACSHINSCPKQATLEDGNIDLIPILCAGAGMGLSISEDKGVCANENIEGNDVNNLHNSGPAPPKQEVERRVRPRRSKLTGGGNEEAEESTSASADTSSLSVADRANADAKLEFDLNEGFNADDSKYGDANNLMPTSCSASIPLINSFPFGVSSVSRGLPAPITIAAAAKRPFVPPDDLLRSKGELGWKGSAATSAFRPAEPRKFPDVPLGSPNASFMDPSVGQPSRHLLDFDLNVPDERIIEDLACRLSAQDASCSSHSFGGLDLDLNRVDEPFEMGNNFTSSCHRVDVMLPHVKSSSGGFLRAEQDTCRDFDLNDGPAVDEVSVEPSSFSLCTRNNVPSQPPVPGLRMSKSEMGNISAWFTQSENYPAVSIPPILPDRVQPFPIIAPGGPQRLVAPISGSTPFNLDVCRGTLLSSSPAVPFPSTPFQYPIFPFGTSFPLPSTAFSGSSTGHVDSSSGGRIWFPAMDSQLLAPAGVVAANYPRPYVVTLADGSHSVGAESSRKWGRKGLDLNDGPLGAVMGGREMSSLAPRQLSVTSSQALAEEQAQFFRIAGGSMLKDGKVTGSHGRRI